MNRGSKKLISKEFFKQDTLKVAEELIGKLLLVKGVGGIITETEAYKDDEASHAFKKTPRSSIMYDSYGKVYVYFVYGNHYCLNFTCDDKGPGAVLIRAIKPTHGIKKMIERRKTEDLKKLAVGPGRLCQALDIDESFNGEDLGKRIKVYDVGLKPRVKRSKRIGIKKATHLEWRFYDPDSEFISK